MTNWENVGNSVGKVPNPSVTSEITMKIMDLLLALHLICVVVLMGCMLCSSSWLLNKSIVHWLSNRIHVSGIEVLEDMLYFRLGLVLNISPWTLLPIVPNMTFSHTSSPALLNSSLIWNRVIRMPLGMTHAVRIVVSATSSTWQTRQWAIVVEWCSHFLHPHSLNATPTHRQNLFCLPLFYPLSSTYEAWRDFG